MDGSFSLIEPTLIQKYAGQSLERWQALIGSALDHRVLGVGRILDVTKRDGQITLKITFDGSGHTIPKHFSPQVLDQCKPIELPATLARQISKLTISQPNVREKSQEENPPPSLPPSPRMIEPHSQTGAENELVRPPPIFEVGQEIVVRTESKRRGLVHKPPFWGESQWQYEVFFSADDRRVYRESDLEKYEVVFKLGGLGDLLRNLALVKLQRPLREHLYALYGSRTKFEVYQFKPVLKFLSNPDQRILIADEVGLGKTIEAGIIYLELQARLELNRALVVCPSGLRNKWQEEMKQRFDEEFDILDAEGIRRFIRNYGQYGENTRLRGITSLELLRRGEFAEAFSENRIHFDLVIIDEAHHCRNSATLAHELATILSENADAMLLLTATPLQTGNEDLFNLLRILNPGEFDDLDVFLNRLKPNGYINQAAEYLSTGDIAQSLRELKKVETTQERGRFSSNPYYQEVIRLLSKPLLRKDEMILAQRKIVELNTLAQVYTRTRKRDIVEKAPVRAAFVLRVDFSPTEERFYKLVVQYTREEFRRLHGTNYAAGWASIMRERQTASCIAAARERFANLAKEAQSDIEDFEEDIFDLTVLEELEDEPEVRHTAKLRPFRHRLPATSELEKDSKFDVFWEALQKVLQEDRESKVIVFSFFKATIEYLYKRLRQLGVDALWMHGSIAIQNRKGIMDKFRQNPNMRVLISSEVGAEGLDFQFSNTIFNYDLPWNPMRLEQRIGRIDRFGQESPRVRIYNLVIQNSIESRILMRLYERIGLFEAALGDIEAILGEVIRELTRKVYTQQLTPDEEIALADRMAENIIRQRQELEEFERKRLQFMGQEAIFSTLVNQTIESGNYISEVEIQGLVETFIQDAFQLSRLECNQPFDGTYCLWVNEDLDAQLRGFILKKKKGDRTASEFLKAISPGKQLPVTFNDQMASQRKLLHFITLRHPLAQAALDYWKEKINPAETFTCIAVRMDGREGSRLASGDYFFFLFTVHATGMESTSRLTPVAVVPKECDIYTDLSRQLLHLLQTSSSDLSGALPTIDKDDLEAAQQAALWYMTSQREALEKDLRNSNEALIEARLQAITQSYQAKQRRVQEAMEKVSEPRIIRMREGQLHNQAASYQARRKEIEAQRQVTTSFSLALRGLVRVEYGGGE
jgi:superfamily II DNA/RNA helicase